MILEHVTALNTKRIILASASPRRAELLKQIGLNSLAIIPSRFAEDLDKSAFGNPKGYALETAKRKALEVAERLKLAGDVPDLIISADTVVEIDGEVLEKPADHAEAVSMLTRMSGRLHNVHTGFTLIVPSPGGDVLRSQATSTHVEFAQVPQEAIQAYVATGEPFDKAGAYGAQGPAGTWIRHLDGCYFNVMGLPLHELTWQIKDLIDKGHLRLS